MSSNISPISTMTAEEHRCISQFSDNLQSDPENMDARYQLALVYLNHAKRMEAIGDRKSYMECMLKIACISPNFLDENSHAILGNYALENGNIEGALIASKNAIKQNSKNFKAIETHINALIYKKDLAGARELAVRSVQEMPESGDVLSMLGYIEIQSNQFDCGVDLLEKAAPLTNDPLFAKMNLFLILASTAKFERAARLLLDLIKASPNDNALIMCIYERIHERNVAEQIFSEWRKMLEDDLLFLAHIYDRLCHMTYLLALFKESARIAQLSIDTRRELAKKLGLDRMPCEVILEDHLNAFGGLIMLPFLTKMRKLGWESTELILLKNPDESANPHLMNLMAPHCTVIADKPLIEDLSKKFGQVLTRRVAYHEHDSQLYRIEEMMALVDKAWRDDGRSPLLSVPASTEAFGYEALARYGFKPGDWFVALHARKNPSNDPEAFSPRDARDIETYFDAINSIIQSGGWVVRMGDANMPPLPQQERVIDLTNNPDNTDVMNVFLWGKARFFFGLNSGPAYIPHEFGTRSIFVNWIPLIIQPPFEGDIYIPKLLWDTLGKRYLTFSEMFDRGVAYSENFHHLKNAGIEIHDSKSEDIAELVAEMFATINGQVNYTPEDNERQAKFKAIMQAHGRVGESRIGNSFLRKYPFLVEKTI